MKIGVIIGRFQTPQLHAGHLNLIGSALHECDKVVILFGCTKDFIKDDRNPYHYTKRQEIIQRIFPQVTYNIIEDCSSNKEWSEKVDNLLETFIEEDIVLYHSRDSFKESYIGKFSLKEIPEVIGYSATQIREQLKNEKK